MDALKKSTTVEVFRNTVCMHKDRKKGRLAQIYIVCLLCNYKSKVAPTKILTLHRSIVS